MHFSILHSQLARKYEYMSIYYIIYYLNLLFSSFIYIVCAFNIFFSLLLFMWFKICLFFFSFFFFFTIQNFRTCNRVLFSKNFVAILWNSFILLVNFIKFLMLLLMKPSFWIIMESLIYAFFLIYIFMLWLSNLLLYI